MLHLDPKRLQHLLGHTLRYQGQSYQVIDILPDELALVLRDVSGAYEIQANQYGEAGELQPRTLSVPLRNVRGDALNPELPDLAAALDALGT